MRMLTDRMNQSSELLPLYRQAAYGVQFERGEAGLRALARRAAVIIIVDVLSFSTAVDVAVSREALVRPTRLGDEDAVRIATEFDALLAVPRGERSTNSPYSLSPPTLATLPKGARLVLPSPNGAALTKAALRDDGSRRRRLPAQRVVRRSVCSGTRGGRPDCRYRCG